MELPVEHDKCPVCGSSVRIVEALTKQLKEDGSLPQGFGDGVAEHVKGICQTLPLVDPKHLPVIIGPTVKAKAIEVYWDFCECGIMYATRCNVIDVPLQIQQQQQPNRAMRRGNLPGTGPYG